MSLPVKSAVPDVRIVPYAAERKSEIAELLNVCLAEKVVGARDVDYWSWKHEQNPFGRSLLLLADCDGRLVGLRAFMRWRLRVGEKQFVVAKPVDSVTDPGFQRRGIFTRLTSRACEIARAEGVRFLFNTPNGNSVPGYLKLGWSELKSLPLYIKPLRLISAAYRAARWRYGVKRIPAAEDFFRNEPTAADSLFASEGLAALLQARGADRFATDCSAAFFRWRYAQHPHIPYYAECVGGNGGLEGVLIYRTNCRYGLREIMINALWVANESQSIVQELLRKLQTGVAADYVVAHFGDASFELAALRSLGFLQLPRRRITFVVRNLDGVVTPNPLDAANWNLCFGDLEGL